MSSEKEYERFSKGAIEYYNKLEDDSKHYHYVKPFVGGPDFTVFFQDLYAFLNIVQTLNLMSRSKILDVGCGPGWFSVYLAKLGHIVSGIDISPDFISIATTLKKSDKFPPFRGQAELTCDFYVHDIDKEPFLSECEFDCAIFYSSLHHFVNPEKVLKNILDYNLKQNGKIIVYEGVRPPEGSVTEKEYYELMEKYDTLERPFDPEELDSMLKECGYDRITFFEPINGLFLRNDDTIRTIKRFIKNPSTINVVMAFKPEVLLDKYKDLLAIPDDEEFLIKAYMTILGREPDKEGFDCYLSNLNKHKMTREAIIQRLLNFQNIEKRTYEMLSDKYKDLLAIQDDEEFLIKAYMTILGREPDKEGLDCYLPNLNDHKMTREAMIQTLLNFQKIEKRTHEELLATYKDLLAIPNSEEFLVKAYMNILGREPDKEGFDCYLPNLNDHKITREVMIQTLLNFQKIEKRTYEEISDTYKDLLAIPENDEFLIKAYMNILGREPDKEGFDCYLSNLTDNKMTKMTIIRALLNSDERKQYQKKSHLI